ncbi:MAG: lytic murein transglycosylase B [Campylobacterota bacterium]|nr:lytic murein transglycosylase B [Campylobacterota bacterium]
MPKVIKLVFLTILFLITESEAENYLWKPDVRLFIDEIVEEHQFNRVQLNMLFGHAKYQQTALSFYNSSIKPLPQKYEPVKTGKKCYSKGSWDIYSHNLLGISTVYKGIAYMRKHRKTLNRAYKKYGVPPEYVTAIIGIESFYGANTGKYPVFDTLTTLAFEPNRRQDFFRSELKAFLTMTQREKVNPRNVKGSYAGAIGLGQFMPSNYQSLAVDFNHDGKIRMNDPVDAIGSIAHYFKRSGWKKGQEVAIPVSFLGHRYTGKKTGYQYKYSRASLKELRPKRRTSYNGDIYLIKLQRSNRDELWYGTKNFYAITRYNHSDYYAMAVHQLAQKIMGRNISQPSNMKKGIIIQRSELDTFLDSPVKGRKFIIDL